MVVFTSTVTAGPGSGGAPLATVMAKVSPGVVKAGEPTPSGTGAGTRTALRNDQPLGLAASPHTALLAPYTLSAPTVPPKFTLPPVAATKSATGLLLLLLVSASVGKVKSHHTNPFTALPLGST